MKNTTQHPLKRKKVGSFDLFIQYLKKVAKLAIRWPILLFHEKVNIISDGSDLRFLGIY